jgi:hypothetical protein
LTSMVVEIVLAGDQDERPLAEGTGRSLWAPMDDCLAELRAAAEGCESAEAEFRRYAERRLETAALRALLPIAVTTWSPTWSRLRARSRLSPARQTFLIRRPRRRCRRRAEYPAHQHSIADLGSGHAADLAAGSLRLRYCDGGALPETLPEAFRAKVRGLLDRGITTLCRELGGAPSRGLVKDRWPSASTPCRTRPAFPLRRCLRSPRRGHSWKSPDAGIRIGMHAGRNRPRVPGTGIADREGNAQRGAGRNSERAGDGSGGDDRFSVLLPPCWAGAPVDDSAGEVLVFKIRKPIKSVRLAPDRPIG